MEIKEDILEEINEDILKENPSVALSALLVSFILCGNFERGNYLETQVQLLLIQGKN